MLAAHAHGGTLDVDAKPKHARLFLEGGRIVWAESGDSSDVETVVAQAASWPDGTFTLLDKVVLPDGVTRLDLDVDALLAEIARKRDEAEAYDDRETFRVIDQESLEFTPDELKLLIRIGLGRTFADLVADRDRVQLTKTLRRFEREGIVARVLVIDEAPAITEPAPRVDPSSVRTAGNLLIASLTSTTGEAFALVDDEQTIGRLEENAIPIADGSVSSRHARIVRASDGFFIEDLGSRNGTFVNGDKVTERRRLADNDILRFGKIVFTFNIASELRRGDTTSGGRAV